jgi:glycosyltransferase involved in cell wall biosynthesis
MHKGFRTLTEALERTEKTDPVVVTCGYPLDGIENSTPSLAELRRELWPRWEKLIADGRLIVMRNLLDDQLRRLRSQCKAFVLPSEYEGFGLPLVEAVYHHRAAIATSIPAHMEILTRYPQYRLATVFEPGSAEVLARNLNQDRVDVSPEPERWKEEIDETWSWLHAVRRILTALN